MQPKCVRPARLANCSKFVSIMTSRQALKGHMLVVLYMMCFWGNYAVTHARLVRGSLHDPTDGDKFLERLPGRLLRDGDSQDVASDKPFFPSQCKVRHMHLDHSEKFRMLKGWVSRSILCKNNIFCDILYTAVANLHPDWFEAGELCKTCKFMV